MEIKPNEASRQKSEFGKRTGNARKECKGYFFLKAKKKSNSISMQKIIQRFLSIKQMFFLKNVGEESFQHFLLHTHQ